MTDKPGNTKAVLTIGHSTRPLEAFLQLLKENRVGAVLDIRSVPRSRHNPQFNADVLASALREVGISYEPMAGLGGLRRPRPDSPNQGWHNASFRGFADYMQTAEFEKNLQLLIGLAGKGLVALMCAEVVPWRCHRFLIADALVIRGVQVKHILGPNSRRTRVLTPWAEVKGSQITYSPILF